MEIIKIVITGGPCAGKSVAMNIIKETFTNTNIYTFSSLFSIPKK